MGRTDALYHAVGCGGQFIQGVNTLTINFTDNDNFLEAVRVEGLVSGRVAGVPEPGSVALFIGMSITGAGFLARHKKVRKAA